MKINKISFLLFFLFSSLAIHAQNLPSLLQDKNINATFSILAYDEEAQEWGIAVATNNIYVGNSTIYIRPGQGAFSVIAETEPKYAIQGFELLQAGKSIEAAIIEVKKKDEAANYRQVSGIDAKGNVFAFTGESLKYWQGKSSHRLGDAYVVMGNQLAPEVLSKMAAAFEKAKGSLAQRLLISLSAGQEAGGQISGKQSAAVVVKGTHNEWFNQIDLRVDNSKNPIEELGTLMNYHYGRIRLNQANYAQRAGNSKRANEKLAEAEAMLEGWTGIYPRIAKVNMSMGKEAAAVNWIKKGLGENPNWSAYLPAFYCLRDHPEIKSILKVETFKTKDWESALAMLSNLGREMEAIELGEELLGKGVKSSYLHFLLGRSYFYEKDNTKAIMYLEKALEMDEENVEAKELWDKINSN